jgi:hypothetical protein
LTSGYLEQDDPSLRAISPHAIPSQQLAAAVDPYRPTRDLVADGNPSSRGNFGDFGSLFDQLGQPQVIELGNPLPRKNYLPGKRAGRCPAAHNHALLGEELT